MGTRRRTYGGQGEAAANALLFLGPSGGPGPGGVGTVRQRTSAAPLLPKAGAPYVESARPSERVAGRASTVGEAVGRAEGPSGFRGRGPD